MSQGIANRENQRRSTWLIAPIAGFFLMAASLTLACDEGLQHTTSTPAPATSPAPTNAHVPMPPSSPTPASTPTAAGGLTVQGLVDDGPLGSVDAGDGNEAVPQVGSTWLLHLLNGQRVIEGSFLALKVYETSVGGYGGCNGISGGPITFGEEPADPQPFFGPDGVIHQTDWFITARGCVGPEGLGEQEDGYAEALFAGQTYRLEDDRLDIFDKNGTPRLVFYRQEPLPGQPIDLQGTAWRLVDDGAVTLTFLGGLVTGETACRDLLATYNLFPRLNFPSMGMRGSGESCSEEAWKSEGITDFLSYAWEYSVYEEAGSRRLGMRSSEGDTRIFEEMPPTFDNVTDVEWSLTSLVRVGEHFTLRDTGVISGSKVTISFHEDGFSGSAGCSSYRGLATLEDGSITVDPQSLYVARETCRTPERVMEQEARYLGLLPKLTEYVIYGDDLYVRTNDDIFLLFVAE